MKVCNLTVAMGRVGSGRLSNSNLTLLTVYILLVKFFVVLLLTFYQAICHHFLANKDL